MEMVFSVSALLTGDLTIVLPSHTLLRDIAKGRNRISLKMTMMLTEDMLPYFYEVEQDKALATAAITMTYIDHQEMLPASDFSERAPTSTSRYRDMV